MSPALLIAALAFASAGQCPNGQCARPVAVQAAPSKGWYQLLNYPGWLGYGAKNAAGQVVVEQFRQAAVQAAPACSTGRCPVR